VFISHVTTSEIISEYFRR